MSWQSQITTMVRHIVNDVDSSNYKYTDARLKTAILVAAQLVTFDAILAQTYTIDLDAETLSPDPTATATLDKSFIVLTSLKTACVLVGSEVRLESGNSISIKDGPSAIDLRGVSSTLMGLYKHLCEEYEQTVIENQAGNSLAGHAILGPYSPGSDFVRRNYSDHDLRGGYFRY